MPTKATPGGDQDACAALLFLSSFMRHLDLKEITIVILFLTT
jgi:hypothetical protein